MWSLKPKSRLAGVGPQSVGSTLLTGEARAAGPIAPRKGALAGRAARPRWDRRLAGPVGRVPLHAGAMACAQRSCGRVLAKIARVVGWLPLGGYQPLQFQFIRRSFVAFTWRHYSHMTVI